MTQDERWQKRYDEVMEFITSNHRNPSKYNLEEHDIYFDVRGQMEDGRCDPHVHLESRTFEGTVDFDIDAWIPIMRPWRNTENVQSKT